VLGTVKGDLYDIGRNLVAMMLKGAGFNVIDIGVDAPAEKFVEAAREAGKCIVALSALLTTTMPAMAEVVEALKDAGLSDTGTLIGGAPVTQKYADEIGADGFAHDAGAAVEKVKQLIGSGAQ